MMLFVLWYISGLTLTLAIEMWVVKRLTIGSLAFAFVETLIGPFVTVYWMFALIFHYHNTVIWRKK